MFHISNFQCKLEFASKLNNLEKTQYINKVQHNFKNNISEVIYLSYVNSIYKMFKTLPNVYEILNQNLHNLCTNEHKNLQVKNLRVHIYNILFIIAMNKNIFFILYIN